MFVCVRNVSWTTAGLRQEGRGDARKGNRAEGLEEKSLVEQRKRKCRIRRAHISGETLGSGDRLK